MSLQLAVILFYVLSLWPPPGPLCPAQGRQGRAGDGCSFPLRRIVLRRAGAAGKMLIGLGI